MDKKITSKSRAGMNGPGDLAFLASIIDSSDDAIPTKTLDGIVTSWNRGAEKVFGYTSAEMIGHHISILIPPHLHEEENKIMEKIREGLEVDHYETERLRKDDKTIYVSLIISPVKDPLGNIVGASKISRDITSRKESERKLRESEQQFRHAFDNMLEGVQIHDRDWRYTYANDTLVKYSKCSREELIGYTMMEKYPGIEQTNLFKTMQQCMNDRIARQFETEFVFPDSTTAWFELSIEPVPEGIFILSIDISKRKAVEARILSLNGELEQKVLERMVQLEGNVRQLKESEEKFQKAFQGSPTGITIARFSDSTFLDVNEAFVQMTGYSKEECIGSNPVELNLIVNAEKREAALQKVKKQGSARHIELTLRNRSGNMLEILSSVETILLRGEKHMISTIYDITDRKRAEEQLMAVNKELETFSYSVSHDLRAPLRAINSYAQILEEDHAEKLDAEGIRYLHSIMHNSKKMGTLIDDLLEFSRLERKQQVIVSEIDMAALVDSVKKELLAGHDENNTEFKVNVLPPARGDQALLRQVWVNLISNAIKYSKLKPVAQIEIGAYKKDDFIVYSVKDNGAGFDMQYYNKLFGVFERLHSHEEFEGTGIGLAIVQKIIHRHHGTVWAESVVNEGTCFYFSLPSIGP